MIDNEFSVGPIVIIGVLLFLTLWVLSRIYKRIPAKVWKFVGIAFVTIYILGALSMADASLQRLNDRGFQLCVGIKNCAGFVWENSDAIRFPQDILNEWIREQLNSQKQGNSSPYSTVPKPE